MSSKPEQRLSLERASLFFWRNIPARLSRISFGKRLLILYGSILVGVLLLLGTVLYANEENFLLQNTMAGLREQAAVALGDGFSDPKVPFLRHRSDPHYEAVSLVHLLTSAQVSVVVYDLQGNLLSQSSDVDSTLAIFTPEPIKPNSPRQSIVAPSAFLEQIRAGQAEISAIVTVSTQGGPRKHEKYLLMLFPVHQDNQVVAVLQLSTSLRAMYDVLAHQRFLLVVAIGLALFLSIAVSIPLTRSALAPLQRMAETSGRIAAGDLRQRVDLPQTDDEIGRLAASFNHMVDRLEEAFERQRQFVADASHELRTPLTSIKGSLDMILLGATQDNPALTQQMLKSMNKEVGRLSRLVRDLLALTKMDDSHHAYGAQLLHWQDIYPAALLQELAVQAEAMAHGQEIRLALDDHAGAFQLYADPDRLRQVLLNLIDNALAFTPSGGTITLGLNRRPGAVCLSVADTGTGIDPADQPYVFERFYRSDASRSRRNLNSGGGSGLGLAIARAIVTAHGGTIELSSIPGIGSTFTVIIPETGNQGKW